MRGEKYTRPLYRVHYVQFRGGFVPVPLPTLVSIFRLVYMVP